MKQPQNKRLSVVVVQDGARLHYAVPLAFARAGALARMYTDWFLKKGLVSRVLSAGISLMNPSVRAAMGRRCDEIPGRLVRINPLLTLTHRRGRKNHPTGESFFRWQSQTTAKWIARKGFAGANALFGFIRSIDPDLCALAKSRGLLTVGDQMIAPAAEEGREAAIQAERFPGWELPSAQADFDTLIELESQSWPQLDVITCASDYVRNGLLTQGISPTRIHVIPYPIDASHFPMRTTRESGPLTVGCVGAIGLRKGTPYFVQVARRLASPNLRFAMIGHVQLKDSIMKQNADCVDFVGRVQRAEVVNWLQKFDILLFPTTCEGSAGSVMEAMSCGVPVVTTPNSGSIIRDGVEGLIHRYDDIDGLCAAVQQLAGDVALRKQFAQAGRKRAEEMNIARYSQSLLQCVQSQLDLLHSGK